MIGNAIQDPARLPLTVAPLRDLVSIRNEIPSRQSPFVPIEKSPREERPISLIGEHDLNPVSMPNQMPIVPRLAGGHISVPGHDRLESLDLADAVIVDRLRIAVGQRNTVSCDLIAVLLLYLCL